MGEGGIKNGHENSDVFYGRPIVWLFNLTVIATKWKTQTSHKIKANENKLNLFCKYILATVMTKS